MAMRILSWSSLSVDERRQALRRPVQQDEAAIHERVREIVSDVRARGDLALLEFTRRFDGVALSSIEVSTAEFAAAETALDTEQRQAIDRAIANVRRFHEAQLGAPLRVEWVGPKAGAQLRNAAVASILITLVAIMLYVGIRFDMRYAPGAALCLLHDAIAATGALMLAGKELNLEVIAALLTIIGFSVNDTVVVYDRVRENARRLRGATFPELVDLSVSEMLGRTVITTGTAIISLVPFLIWGTNALQDFSYVLIIGMTTGAYSTVFVALPLTHWLDKVLAARRKAAPRRRAPAPRAKRELNPL